MRGRIALQLRKLSRVQHFARNSQKCVSGFAETFGVRTSCRLWARVLVSLLGTATLLMRMSQGESARRFGAMPGTSKDATAAGEEPRLWFFSMTRLPLRRGGE